MILKIFKEVVGIQIEVIIRFVNKVVDLYYKVFFVRLVGLSDILLDVNFELGKNLMIFGDLINVLKYFNDVFNEVNLMVKEFFDEIEQNIILLMLEVIKYGVVIGDFKDR